MSLRKSAFLFSLTAGVMGFAAVAIAQDQPIVEVPNARNSAIGQINGDNVNVRSGPAESYYPTGQLNKGDRVKVVGHRFDWLKIVPPEGSFSYVAKIYVDRDGASPTGKINRDDVLVRAGSSQSEQKSQPQTKLSRGATVEIIGEADEYYKVKPPEGAYLYVAKQFVDQVTEGAAVADTGAKTPAATQDAKAEAKSSVAAETDSADTSVSDAFAPTPAATPEKPRRKTDETEQAPARDARAADQEAEFRKLETRFAQTKEQPLEEQPVTELLQGYTQLQDAAGLTATSRRMVGFRVKYLQALQKQQQELLAAKQSATDFEARQAQLEEQRKQIEQRMKDQAVTSYSAVGQLQTSTIQRDGLPLMRLVDPADKRTLIYVVISDAKQRGLVGSFVGIRGQVTKDERLGVDYIEPTVVEAVDQSRVFKGVTAPIYPPSAIRPQ